MSMTKTRSGSGIFCGKCGATTFQVEKACPGYVMFRFLKCRMHTGSADHLVCFKCKNRWAAPKWKSMS